MNPHRILNRALGVLLVAAASLPAFAKREGSGPVVLLMHPKVDSKLGYDFKFALEVNGSPATFTGDIVSTVTAVKPDGGYSFKQEMSNGTLHMGSDEMQHDLDTTVLVCDSTNKVLGLDPQAADPDNLRFLRLLVPVVKADAVAVGDTWETKYDKDSKFLTPGQSNNYKVVSEEKIGADDCFKVDFDHKETTGDSPAEAKGDVWIRLSDGVAVSLSCDVTNVPAANMTFSGHIEQKLKGPKAP